MLMDGQLQHPCHPLYSQMFASGVAGDSWWTYDLLKDIYHSAKSMNWSKYKSIIFQTRLGHNGKRYIYHRYFIVLKQILDGFQ